MKLKDPEGQRLEYKREWCETAKKTMIAFANDLGGILQIGVADDGEVVGCNFDQVDRSVHSFAREGVQPSMAELVQVRRVDLDGKAVASVLIAPGSRRPYGFRGKVLTEGGAYIRLGGQTVAATFDEVMGLIQRGDPRTWESRVCREQNLTFTDAKTVFDAGGIPFEEANWLGYGLQNRNREFTNLALLLSDQNPYPVIINKYDAAGKLTGSDRVRGSVLRQWESVRERLSEVNSPILDKETAEFSRQETHPWPMLALREALTNTLAHRDYSSPLQVAVNIHPDEMTFLTPGGIPPELTLEDALLEGASFCRNEKLAELFMRLHWMEKAGTGFGDII
ncbi:MAG: RNA-binding domain-containing protein, partial [Duodenibacillus sp.]